MTGEQSRASAVAFARVEAEQANLREDMKELREEVRYMKRALFGLIFTILGGMILFLVSIAAGWLGAA